MNGSEDEHSDGASTSSSSSSDILPVGLTRRFLGTWEAVLIFHLARMEQLKSLTLRNITVNTNALITWLCNQSQLAQSCSTLRLDGTTILYVPSLLIFLQVLINLNVRLIYDPRNTVWYSIDPDMIDLNGSEPELMGSVFKRVKRERGTYSIKMWSGPCDWDIHECMREQAGQMLNESDILVETPLRATARFVHRPWTVKHLVSGTDRSMSDELLMYCLIRDHDQRYTFKWLGERERVQVTSHGGSI